ncbi:hypothetical protein HHI36_017186 [Cryptolaemus montrouzieri]|uniref:Uncharacterized protein n=1 Tax=Cryptolaemus montrouzieri TaxID=559131 RepID=A0ABD2NMX4_9CUCU
MGDFSVEQKKYLKGLLESFNLTINEKIDSLDTRIVINLKEIREKFKEYDQRISELEERNNTLYAELIRLNKNQSKKNLIMRGVNSEDSTAEEAVLNVINDSVKIKINSGDICVSFKLRQGRNAPF